MTDELKSLCIEIYKETYSVSEIIRRLQNAGHKIGRGVITNVLKEAGIYEGLNGENYLKHKVEKFEKLMMQRYGVVNWGQTKDGGWKPLNSVSYKKFSYIGEDYKKYADKVTKITKKNLKKTVPPEYCFYTGIKFADATQEIVNPNDPRKRSVDHIVPILICYLNDVKEEDAGSLDNLVFVLKYVNSVKSNTLHDSFLAIAPKIRKAFINEGFESN
jgi:hypothetical protein